MPSFDLAIADEAHRCAGPQAGVFATVLDAAKIKARRRLFMTATPRYYTGRVQREAREADWEVASMDDEAKFGPVLHRLTFAQAIEQDLLSDYQVVVVGVSDREYREMAERAAFVTADGETVTDARTLARQIGLLRAMRNHDLHRVVSFHSRIEQRKPLRRDRCPRRDGVDAVRAADPTGRLWTDHVSGRDDRRRARGAAQPAARRSATTSAACSRNARCLAEGVDVPTLDGVAFIDPRRSQVDVVQAVGRAIRKADDKTRRHHRHPGASWTKTPTPRARSRRPSSTASGRSSRPSATTTKSSPRNSTISVARRGRRGTIGVRPNKIVLDLPVGVGVVFAKAFDTRVVEKSTSPWEQGIGAAFAYREQHGDLRVPQWFVTDDGFRLGSWISSRRTQRKAQKLSPDRVAALDALGMIWEPHEVSWGRALAAARTYREGHGDLQVPYSFVTADGFRLGEWLGGRRVDRNRGWLSPKRIHALDALGMIWDVREENWQRGIAAASAYHREHGDLRVSARFVTEDGFPLGTWITVRRSRHSQGTLSPERVAALDALDMIWEPYEDEWGRGLSAARGYRDAHGHIRVPTSFVTDSGFPLGSWISNRRTDRRANKLAPDRVAALDALGMIWDARDDQWQRGIAAARAYREERGDLLVPVSFVRDDGFKLGSWIFTRRLERRQGALSEARIAALDALDMNWDPVTDGWRQGLVAAESYRAEHGHLRVQSSFVGA